MRNPDGLSIWPFVVTIVDFSAPFSVPIGTSELA